MQAGSFIRALIEALAAAAVVWVLLNPNAVQQFEEKLKNKIKVRFLK
jgi:hypothetical protein